MPESSEILKTRPPSSLTHFRRRTMLGVIKAWREVRGEVRERLGAEIEPSLPKQDMDRLKEQMQDCLDPKGGELTARAHTAELGHTYLHLNEAGQVKFLKLLATDFDIDPAKVEKAIAVWQKASGTEKTKAEAGIREALVSPRSVILRQFTALPDGFKFLVDMRADLLDLMQKDSRLKALEYDLKTILSSWFDIGLLDLVQLTWNSPAAMLEKLITYEAVHAIRSWDDLKNRLDTDRRVYAFFHNKMPLEPLIFIQIAFVEGLSDNIQKLLDTESPPLPVEKADTAIFYSISNAQKGLSGISFGNFLIKRVAAELAVHLPQIKTYATLSPIPGLRSWLDPILSKGDTSVLTPNELKTLRGIKEVAKAENSAFGLLQILNTEWYKDPELAETLKPILMRLAARYLLEEKKNGKPLDPVANFHLFNGARLERLNWLGDVSAKGMKQACGMMVNYHYKLSEIDDNHEAFVSEGKIIASRQVRGASVRLPPPGSEARTLAILKLSWLCLGVIVCIDAVWMHCINIHFAWDRSLWPFVPLLAFAGVSYRAVYLQPDRHIFLATQSFLLFMVGAPAVDLLCYLGMSLARPLVDPALMAFDHAVGFDWWSYVKWVQQHNLVRQALSIGYGIQQPQVFVTLWALALMKRDENLLRFVLAVLLGGLVTSVIASIWPSVAAYIVYNIDPDRAGIHALAGRVHEHDLLGMRAGTLRELSLALKGLVAFPSFHTTLALILIWAAWPVRWWFWLSVLFDMLTIFSTPIDGGHWLADVVGGVAVAMVLIPALCVLFPLPKNLASPPPIR